MNLHKTMLYKKKIFIKELSHMDDEKILFKKISVEVSYSNNLKFKKQFKILKYIYIFFL